MAFMLAITASLALGSTGDEVVQTAREYIGYPYVYGDEGTYGFDCSGFVKTVFARHGYTLPRTARNQSKTGEPVAFKNIKAGDLIFFTPSPSSNRISHVGIATGDGSMVHASSGRGEVVIDRLTMRYWRKHRAEGRRVIGTPFSESVDLSDQKDASSSAPVTFGFSSRPRLWSAGPTDLRRYQSGFGVRALSSFSDDSEALWLLAPTLQLRSSTLDAEVVAQLPIVIDANGEPRLFFEGSGGFLRGLGRVRVGAPEAKLHLEASRDLTLSLGPNTLLQRLTPMASSRSLLGLPTRASFAITAAYRAQHLNTRLALDDIIAPSVLATHIESQTPIRLGFQAVLDPNPSDSTRAALGLTAAYPLLNQRRLSLTLNAQASAFTVDTLAPLFSTGAQLRFTPAPLDIQLDVELRRFAPGAAPDLFGIDYRSQRNRGRWDQLDQESQLGSWQNGLRLNALFALTRRFAFRAALSLADPGALIDQNHLELGLIAREWQLGSRWSASTALSYHQRFVSGFGSPADDQELYFLTTRLTSLDGFSVGAQLARRVLASGPRLDAALDLSYTLEF